MDRNRTDEIIRQYLDHVAEELRGTPVEERDEILSDLRTHIDEAIGDPTTASEAHVRNVLGRLGDPADVAREARGRTTSQPQVYRKVSKSPGLPEIAAIALTALAWPIGVVLAWVSPRWLTRDKVIATVIPLFGFFFFLVLMFGLTFATSPGAPMPDIRPVPGPGPVFPGPFVPSLFHEVRQLFVPFERVFALPIFLIGTVGSPFISALYLAIRLQSVEERFYPDDTRATNGVPAGRTI